MPITTLHRYQVVPALAADLREHRYLAPGCVHRHQRHVEVQHPQRVGHRRDLVAPVGHRHLAEDKRVIINDADTRVHAFWDAVLNRTAELVKLIRDTPLTVEEWQRQRQLYLKPGRASKVRVGFAAFYLNRCNRSGIIGNAGVIGGLNQTGKWKIDARFNRDDLVARVERIARYRERIELFNLDATELLKTEVPKPSRAGRVFVYLDPPYYAKGSQLYLNHYTAADHTALADYLSGVRFPWVMSYDNTPAIRKLYDGYRRVSFNLGYSARAWKIGKELLVIPNHLRFPTAWPRRIPDLFITAADRISASMPTDAIALE